LTYLLCLDSAIMALKPVKTGEEGFVIMQEVKTHGISRAFLVTIIILIIMAGVFIYYYVTASGEISRDNSLILTLSSEKQSLQTQLSSANSQISTLQSQISSLQNDISSYKSQVVSLKSQLLSGGSDISNLQAQISSLSSDKQSLQTQLSSANLQISTLQSQVSSLSSDKQSLQSQLSSANSQISSLQSQNTNLQSIVSLSQSSIKANSVTITPTDGPYSRVVSFLADYAGYLYISGTTTATNGWLQVTDSYPGFISAGKLTGFDTTFSYSGIPVLPGTINVYFGNFGSQSDWTTTITVTYYY